MATKAYEVLRMKSTFTEIKARGGHAAIDYNSSTGELLLMCTRSDWENSKTYGRGSLPQPYTDACIRLIEC